MKLYQGLTFDTLEVKMKRGLSFHEIPKMLSLMTWFQRQFVVEAKAGGHLPTMKTLFHYNQSAGNINHFPNM